MKAARYQRFGEPVDVLSVEDLPVPVPGAGEVRVRMLASPINPSDLMSIRGEYGLLPDLPAVPGFEGVGVVEESGGGLLANLRRGRRVAVLGANPGAWCEQVVARATQVIPVPRDLSLEQAATMFINPVTTWVLLRKVLAVPAGEWLLQTAAASQVGRMVIRLGRQLGIRTINIVRRDAQLDELTRLGGDAVLAFDPAQQDPGELSRMVREITDGRGVGRAIDPVGGATGSAVARCLAPGGRLVVYGTLSDQPLRLAPRELMTSGSRIEGFWLARWLATQSLFGKLRTIRAVTRLVRRGVLVSEIAATFSLDEITAAVRAAEAAGREGKVLVRIDHERE